jgi:uncharacterized protein (TIGR03435 family)
MKTLILLAVLLADMAIGAQQPVPTSANASPARFEVASIKRNRSGSGFVTFGVQPERLSLTNISVRQLIVRAYQVQAFQVVGGPAWVFSDGFDVIAKAESGAQPAQMNAMLQTLLAERFKLKVYRETRPSEVLRLVKARPDGKLGENLKPSSAECQAMGRAGGPGRSGPPEGRIGGPIGGPAVPPPACRMMIGPGRLEVMGQSMASLAATLASQLGRPVIDETGVTGAYDFTLTFMPDSAGRGVAPGVLPPGAPPIPPIDPNAPVLPTALQEQLGLKLESTKGPVEFIVIDSIEQPTED